MLTLIQSITLSQLAAGTWTPPDKHRLQEVWARNEIGTVRVWSSHCNSSYRMTKNTPFETVKDNVFNLVVTGQPNVVAIQLSTVQAFARGHFEAPIVMTLAQGWNWVNQWDQGKRSVKAEVLNQLNWMRGNAALCLKYDRYHFSTVSIVGLLRVIDETIAGGNMPMFALYIEKLYADKAMQHDSYSGSFELHCR